MSFSAGALSLVVVLGVMRIIQGSSRSVRGASPSQYTGFARADETGLMHSLQVHSTSVE